jgi:DNA-binding CsgD family transcriptional regulator
VTVHAHRPQSEQTSEPGEPPIVPAVPDDLVARTFRIGSDEYVLFSFGVPPEEKRFGIEGIESLNPTERSIVALALRGLSNEAIGRARGTTARTIAKQLGGIYRKLGLGSRRELRARAKVADW